MIAALVVPGAPLAALVLLGVLPALRRSGRPAATLSIAAAATSALAAGALALQSGSPRQWELVWAPLAGASPLRFGLLSDGLSAPMAVLVGVIGCLVQIYSLAYMDDEEPAALGRYYAYHSLFVFAMQGLVLAHNVVQTYVFWELVGLGSYLLIGFWQQRPAAARAATKAFWITRLADTAFAAGLVLLWQTGGGSLVFGELFAQAAAGMLAGPLLVAGVAGLYIGAMGKSAQFPFHVWLPDAMEGPTPVSALIHAATMVAAGVYLMIRIAPLLALAPQVAAAILAIGTLTALAAAGMALVQVDLKRVLAYSTVSQLGFMMAAVGAGSTRAAFFHLVTHAAFKALLFLAAGCVIHALHTNALAAMGGLAGRMRLTAAAFLAGALALCGVWPTSGFYSKDAVLAAVWSAGHPLAFGLLLLAAGLTACYIFRAFFLAFLGRRQAASAAAGHDGPWPMALPLVVLSVAALGAGLLAGPLAASLGRSLSHGHEPHLPHPPLWIALAALAVTAAGALVAWAGYQRALFDPARVRRTLAPLAELLAAGGHVDLAFQAAYRAAYRGLARLIGWGDRYLVDGFVNLMGAATASAAARARGLQNGRMQDALYAVVAGLLLLAALALGR